MPIDLAISERLPQGLASAAGVVLRRRDSGASFDLLLLLRGHGATWVGAPGAASSRGRFGGGAEPMSWGEFSLYQSRRRLYAKSVDLREDFIAVRRSRAALAVAMGWHSLLARRLPLGAENDKVMSLLFGSMKNLTSGADPAAADVRFLWRWANVWGVAPPLDEGEGSPPISRGASERVAMIVSLPPADFVAASEELARGVDEREMARARAWLAEATDMR